MKIFKLKQRFKWLIVSSSLTGLTLGVLIIYGFFLRSNTQNINVNLVTVTQGQVEDKITGESGVLKLDNQRNIKSLATGTVEQILVKIGDVVKQGQILIRLQNRDSQIKLQESESELADKKQQISDKISTLQQTEKKLFDLNQEYQNVQTDSLKDIETKKKEEYWKVEKQKIEINKKQQAVSQATSDLAEVKVKLEEDKQLFAKGFISEDELKEREKKLSQAEINLNNAQSELYVSRMDLEKQVLDWQNFIQSVKENSSEPQQKLKEAKSKVEQSQQDVNQAKLALNQVIRELDKLKIKRQQVVEDLRRTVITSPDNGVILDIKLKLGDVIEPKGDILLIGNPSQQIVELKLSPLDATKVKLRQQAEVTVVGLESTKLTGKVQQISLLATGEQNNTQSSEGVKVTAIVRLDQVNQNIVPGTPVTVALIVSRRAQVLVLPNEAIQQTESETFVWMRDTQNKAFKKRIKIGLQGLDNVEITSGLKVGDEVLIPSVENPINEGQSVFVK
ncbi:MAG: HlyD family efflux transporter periplasmic adaptor subunit [Crinalium sp.]